MPTEQEAKPAVNTFVTAMEGAHRPSEAPGEDPLKWLKEQWYVNNEDALDSWEAFKNGLSGLFGDRQKYTRRAEEQLKCRAQRSGEYTVLHTKCIRTLPREEVHRLVNQTQESLDSDPQSLEEIVQDEVERVLAPVSTKPTETEPRPTYAAVTGKYRAPVQKFPPEPRKTDRRAVFDNSRNRRRNFDDVGTEEKYADQTLLAVLRQVPREADPQYVVTDPRRHIADPVSRQAVGAGKLKSDLPRRMGLFRASQAVIDCGQNELVLEDICRDSPAPDAWNLYATRDYTLKPHSLTRITVSGYQTRGDINVVLDGSKHLLFEKNICYTIHGIHIS
ncbi:CCHC-type domain-containing protein [Trichonephila clavipes]|nr:CCHC-type domain-containing protein [Trichonephila clavipes]